jgi:hypothetical protein
LDILGQLRKLIEITFKSGTHDLTIKGADGTIPGTPAPTQDIEVQIGDGPAVQSMTTDSNIQTFTNKTIDSADNTITIDADDPNTTIINIDFDNIKDMGVNTEDILDSAVTTAKIADMNVTTAKIADLNVTTDKLNADAVDNSKLADNAVQTENIVDSNVTTVKIADLNVTNAKLEADAVTNDKLADNAVQTENITDLNVTTAKLAADAVDNSKLADNAVQTENIVDLNVTTAKIADGNVTTAKIEDLNVTTAKLAPDAVDNTKLADNAVQTENIVDGNVTDAKIDTVSASKVTGQFPELLVVDGAAAITTNAITLPNGATYINVTGSGPLSTINSGMNTNKLYYLQNDSVAEILVTAGGNIETGTGGDITWAPGATLAFFDDGMNHNVVGGSGAGGAGGLELVALSSSLDPAEISTHYLVDTTANEITVNLPDGSALSATDQKTATIRFTDSTEQFSTNNLILVPAINEQIDGFSIDESLIVDVAGAWVEVSWDSATSRWALNTSGGSGGGGGGGLIIEEYAYNATLPSPLVKDRHYLIDFGGNSNENASATLPAIGTDVGAIKVTPINNGGGCTITLTADGTDLINDPELGSSASYIIDVGSATFNSNINDNTWEVTDGYWSTATNANETLWQRKFLTADITATDTDITDLGFNGLTVGKTYRVIINMAVAIPQGVGSDSIFMEAVTDPSGAATLVSQHLFATASAAGNDVGNTIRTSNSSIFVAESTDLLLRATISGTLTLQGNGAINETWVIIEELPQHKLTDKFT